MDVTADTALTMRTDPADAGWVQRAWPEAAGIVGFTMVSGVVADVFDRRRVMVPRSP